jgi:hypothetical protein
MENVGVRILLPFLEHFTAIWYTLWSFGNVVINWYIFQCLGILCQEKSGNPDLVCLLDNFFLQFFLYSYTFPHRFLLQTGSNTSTITT